MILYYCSILFYCYTDYVPLRNRMTTRSKGANLAHDVYDTIQDRLLAIPMPPNIVIGDDFDTTDETAALQRERDAIVAEIRQQRDAERLERNIETINRSITAYKKHVNTLIESIKQYMAQIDHERQADAMYRQQLQDENMELTDELERMEEENVRLRILQEIQDDIDQREMWNDDDDDIPSPPRRPRNPSIVIPDSDSDSMENDDGAEREMVIVPDTPPARNQSIVIPDSDSDSIDEVDDPRRLVQRQVTQPQGRQKQQRRRKKPSTLPRGRASELFDEQDRKRELFGSCMNCDGKAKFYEEIDEKKLFCRQKCQQRYYEKRKLFL